MPAIALVVRRILLGVGRGISRGEGVGDEMRREERLGLE